MDTFCGRKRPPASSRCRRASTIAENAGSDRLIEALALQLKGDGEAALQVRDHYAARVFDVAGALGAAALGAARVTG